MKSIFTIIILSISISSLSQVAIGTDNPDGSALLDVESKEKGVLVPRLTTPERDAITNPVEGLIIYNLTLQCLQFYNGTGWECTNKGASSAVKNIFCEGKTISITPCSSITGATINDDPATTGIEYNWNQGTTFTYVAPTTRTSEDYSTRALIEINGQCWYARNMDKSSIAEPVTPPLSATTSRNGSHYYRNNVFYKDLGRLYSGGAALGDHTSSNPGRPVPGLNQGDCAPGFHIPSSCDLMYMEESLGMAYQNLALNSGQNRGTPRIDIFSEELGNYLSADFKDIIFENGSSGLNFKPAHRYFGNNYYEGGFWLWYVDYSGDRLGLRRYQLSGATATLTATEGNSAGTNVRYSCRCVAD